LTTRHARLRFGLYAAAAVVIAVGLGLGGYLFLQQRPIALFESLTATSKPKVGGPFTLVDQKGNEVTDRTLLGKPTVMFFGFTHCPEVCPTTLYEMTLVLEELGEDAGNINSVFVSVDPERDTREALADYLEAFDPHIIGLTGPRDEIQRMADAYRVYFRKVPMDGGDYTVDHTALVYLFDADGNFVNPLNLKQEPQQAAEPIRELLKRQKIS
jgi:protein SCO1/2